MHFRNILRKLYLYQVRAEELLVMPSATHSAQHVNWVYITDHICGTHEIKRNIRDKALALG